MGGLFSVFSFWSLPPIDFAAFDRIQHDNNHYYLCNHHHHPQQQQMHTTDPFLPSSINPPSSTSSSASILCATPRNQQDCRGRGEVIATTNTTGAGAETEAGKEEERQKTDGSDLVPAAQLELGDRDAHVNPNSIPDASPIRAFATTATSTTTTSTVTTSNALSTSSWLDQQPHARLEIAHGMERNKEEEEALELGPPPEVVVVEVQGSGAGNSTVQVPEAEQSMLELHPAPPSSPTPKHNLRIDIPPPPSIELPQPLLSQSFQAGSSAPSAEEDAAAAAVGVGSSDAISQSTLDLACDDENWSALEKIYIYSQSPSSFHRIYIARSLPLFLPQITSCEAVEYVIPLMNSLAVDEDEAVKEALVEKLSSSIWWFLSNCQLTADDEPRLTDGDGDPTSSTSPTDPPLLPVQSFTPLLGTLLLSSNYDVSASARESVVDLLGRIQELDAMGQSSTDPGPHERRLFEEEIIFQVVVGVGRLDIDGEGEGLSLGPPAEGIGLEVGMEDVSEEAEQEGFEEGEMEMGQNHDRQAEDNSLLEQGEDHMEVEHQQHQEQLQYEIHPRTPDSELSQDHLEIPHHLIHRHSLQLRSPSPLPHDVVHTPPPLIPHESDTSAFAHSSSSPTTPSTLTGPVDSVYPPLPLPPHILNPPPIALPSPPLVLDHEYNPFSHATGTSTSTLFNAFHPDLVHQPSHGFHFGPEGLPNTPPIGTPQVEMGPLGESGDNGMNLGNLGLGGVVGVQGVQERVDEVGPEPRPVFNSSVEVTSAVATSPSSSSPTSSTEPSSSTSAPSSSAPTTTSTPTSTQYPSSISSLPPPPPPSVASSSAPAPPSQPPPLPLPTPISELPPVVQDVGIIGLGLGPSSASVRAEYEAGADGFQDQTALGRLASMSLMAAITAKGTLSPDVHTTFVSEVERISHDSIYWVRREAVFALGALAKVVPVELVLNSLLPLIESFATDEAWQIRHSVLFALPAVLTRLAPQHRRQQALKTIKLLWRDSSSKVREAVLEVLGEVIYSFWEDVEEGGPPGELVRLFLGLDTGWEVEERRGRGEGGEAVRRTEVSRDQDVEMETGTRSGTGEEGANRQMVFNVLDQSSISGREGDAGTQDTIMSVETTLSSSRSERGDIAGPSRALIRAFNFPAIVLTLGRDRWDELREHYLILAAETQSKVQQTLAASVGEIAKIVGPQHAREDLIDAWYGFASAEERMVRMKAFDRLETFWCALDKEDRRPIAMFLRRAWNSNKLGWLEREKLIQVLTRLVEISPEHADVFVNLIGKAFKDSFAAVRKAAISAYSQIMSISKAGGEEIQRALRMLHKEVAMLAYSSSFRNRATYIACQQELFDHGLHHDLFLEKAFLDMANSLAKDGVVNVRIGIARLLSGFLAELKISRSIPVKLNEIVEQLALDPIHDVRAFALSTLRPSLGTVAAVKESPTHPSTTFSRPPPRTPDPVSGDAQAAR